MVNKKRVKKLCLRKYWNLKVNRYRGIKYNPDIHCGVTNSSGLPCTRVITCRLHTANQKKSVDGRNDTYINTITRYKLGASLAIASVPKEDYYHPHEHRGLDNLKGCLCCKNSVCKTCLHIARTVKSCSTSKSALIEALIGNTRNPKMRNTLKSTQYAVDNLGEIPLASDGHKLPSITSTSLQGDIASVGEKPGLKEDHKINILSIVIIKNNKQEVEALSYTSSMVRFTCCAAALQPRTILDQSSDSAAIYSDEEKWMDSQEIMEKGLLEDRWRMEQAVNTTPPVWEDDIVLPPASLADISPFKDLLEYATPEIKLFPEDSARHLIQDGSAKPSLSFEDFFNSEINPIDEVAHFDNDPAVTTDDIIPFIEDNVNRSPVLELI